MARSQNKTPRQRLKWWWETRIVGFFRVRLKSLINSGGTSASPEFAFAKKATDLGTPDSDGITVILTAYRRVEYLAEQIEAIRKQTIPPTEIWVWTNASPDELKDVSEIADRVVVSNTNWLFWGRFALGNLARTGFVAFFDDDILPQPRWFENCLDTIQKGHDGILGGSGVLLPIEGGYSSKHKAGWNGMQLDRTSEVDLVGHAWFMRKTHLQYIWREEPHSWDNGEDIHLSYLALKHGGIKTYVPPHPATDQSLWSCRPDFGKIVGRKNVATFKTVDHKQTRSDIVDAYRADGWQLVAERDSTIFRTFRGDLDKFNAKLSQQENFSLVRFGDGEMVVINGEAIDLSEKCNGEHRYRPDNAEDEKHRLILRDSLLFQHEQYFVGLPCRCCVGDAHCDELRAQSKQPEQQLTWANLFVNANYPLFLDQTVPILSDRTVNMICHEKADTNQLSFKVNRVFHSGANAWVSDYERLLDELKTYIDENRAENEVFIFCAGVLSNMLIYQLTRQYPNNTYLDFGSVFDVTLGLGQTRKYLKGSKKRLRQVCVW